MPAALFLLKPGKSRGTAAAFGESVFLKQAPPPPELLGSFIRETEQGEGQDCDGRQEQGCVQQ
ncbi:hypothetical protein HMPREF1546_01278 [Oscillibacter sp. KLE 1745]|nr:hypothetical protein HMPREF1546_01278 [Oscillibacter sp. KLE 1745]